MAVSSIDNAVFRAINRHASKVTVSDTLQRRRRGASWEIRWTVRIEQFRVFFCDQIETPLREFMIGLSAKNNNL